MALLSRPHLSACEGCVEMGIDFETFRALESYSDFENLLKEEIKEVYAENPESISTISYATSKNKGIYSSEVNQKIFDMMRSHDDGCKLAQLMHAELDEAVSQQEAVEAQRDTEKKLNRKERKQQAEEKAHIKGLRKKIAQQEYEIQCLQQKLVNFFHMAQIRVVYQHKSLS